jgi:hypothetical protein
MRSTRRAFVPKSKFDPKEDHLLTELVTKMGPVDWHQIATQIPGRNARQCRERWNNYVNPVLVKEEWRSEEDERLMRKYRELGPKWYAIAGFFEGRSKNDIRNRFSALQRGRVEKVAQKPRLTMPLEVKDGRLADEKDRKDENEVSSRDPIENSANDAWTGECDLENLFCFFS